MFSAHVEYDGGTNGYVADTRDAVFQKVALEFVAAWAHESRSKAEILSLLNDREYEEACDAYFHEHPSEFLTIVEV